MYEIRKAETGDIRQLSGLLAVLLEQEQEFSADHEKQQIGLEMIIDNPETGLILVLQENETGKIIGMVNLLFTVSTALGGRVAILEDMVLLKEYRGQGLGSRLISAALDHASGCGCLRVTLLTDSENTGAHEFYRKNGFRPSVMTAMRYFPGVE